MSVAIPHRSAVGRRPRRVSLALRARVFLRRGMLDRLLAAGADPSWEPELELRAAQVTAPRKRRALGQSLARAVLDAHHPPRWSCAAPLDRDVVRAAAPELCALAAGLTQEATPAPQGVTLARQLLQEPGSPLYAPGDENALREGLRIAWQALGHTRDR
jgi:hypothetical protein